MKADSSSSPREVSEPSNYESGGNAGLSAKQLSLGGIRIDALERSDLIGLVRAAQLAREKALILNHNLHSLYLYDKDAKFRAFYSRASYVYIDGLPVVWLCQMLGMSVTAKHRVTLLDSFTALLQAAEEYRWRVFYLGSTADVISKGIAFLRAQHPQLIISGRNGFFAKSGSESDEVISQINHFEADVLFVGMGMPMQEMWLAEHLNKINASVILTSGATLDYVTGHAYRPPPWAGRMGLYGILRLLSNPKRLWKRYLIEPIFLTKQLSSRLMRQLLRNRRET